MEKAPDALLTIGEMATRLNVKTHILRYWEEQFPMLKPLKRAGGRRLYRPADVRLLEQIKDLLGRQGFTIRGARTHLQKGGEAHACAVCPCCCDAFGFASFYDGSVWAHRKFARHPFPACNGVTSCGVTLPSNPL